MAKTTGKARCVHCGKERGAVICAGCLQVFCFNHLNDHRQQLSQQFDEIENNRDLFRQTLNEQINNPLKHSLIKQIDKWELDSIELIQKTAQTCKDQILQLTDKHFDQIEINLTKFTNELREIRQENDFNEIDLDNLKEKLTELNKKLEEIPNVFIQEHSTSFINHISVRRSSEDNEALFQLSRPSIQDNVRPSLATQSSAVPRYDDIPFMTNSDDLDEDALFKPARPCSVTQSPAISRYKNIPFMINLDDSDEEALFRSARPCLATQSPALVPRYKSAALLKNPDDSDDSDDMFK